LKISDKGLALIKEFEGCLKPVQGMPGHFRAYVCPAGVLTIGFGHTNHHGRQFNSGTVWTQAECDAELATDMELFERVVEKHVKVDLKQHQFDALVSFAFNCGEGALAKSTLLRKLNKSDYEGAASEFHKWNKGGGRILSGLVRRRACESLMFQGIADANFDGKPDQLIHIPAEEPLPQQVDPPEEKPLSKSTIGGGAVVVGGTATAGAAGSLWEVISSVPQSILDSGLKMADKPSFWLFLACGSGAGYVYYRRFLMKKEQGV
jgi:lysozyme